MSSPNATSPLSEQSNEQPHKHATEADNEIEIDPPTPADIEEWQKVSELLTNNQTGE